ncbi:DNA-directed RNA polymerase I subunit RPA2-like isoform X2 [Homarus americanus]|uniref:DNA-directed RNA polymerase I subunit RPA2-like isoform X2 n=1 Tax=Homarus americanus TaxID=6706 RepID=UPI001C47CC12|nr:DNA-directed RNA polymerase I subunit RPA2-like isoform X2 [Homarus americanus]
MGASKKTVELSLKHLKVPNFGKIPQTQNEAIQALAAPHVESFNFLLQEGLQAVVSNIPPLEFATDNGNRISLKIANVAVGRPRLPPGAGETVDYNIYPKECIERGCSYTAPFAVSFEWTRDKQEMLSFRQSLGDVPIIVRSKKCNLYNLSPKELVKHGELVNETGGYFIINGACRLLRMLSSNRRNYPLAMTRESWKKRNISYTDKGVLIRCVQADQTSAINVLHYLTTGEAKLEFAVKRELFFVPLIMILKALMDYSDQQIYQHLIRGRENDMYFTEKIKNMMRDLHAEGLYTQKVCKEYIGNSFRHRLTDNLPEWYTDVEVCDFLLHQNVLIHLKTNAGKFHMICMMARKLYSFVNGETKAEFVDAFSMQEVALGGHTYLQLLKEKLTDLLISIKIQVRIKNRREGRLWVVEDADIRKFAGAGKGMGNFLKTFIATGTLASKTGCGLMQKTGLTVVIEHLNRMRDLSHLRAIHRGAFFVDMKTIEPRRLTGEAWGFICPVHTPDGAPCGLLNHLAQNCIVLSDIPKNPKALSAALTMLGMTPIDIIPLAPYAECLEVILDGCLVGYIRMDESEEFTQKLRIMKSQEEIWKYTEIVLIPKRKYGGQYPGLFLVTSIARMMRPVINLTTYSIEYIGTLEQLYLNVAITPEDIEDGVHTHLEVDKTSLFSNIGKLVPFSDCNPNPRNMYQCQMGKQTMGTPFHNWRAQTTGKAYRLQYPQVPLVRNSHYDDINMEEFCMGFNAVIAIISYTGFDMEDAMVLNKCSMERGLGHGQIYKTEFIDLSMLQGKGKGPTTEISFVFRRNPHEPEQKSVLDSNGLPYPGTQLTEGDAYYSVFDIRQRKFRTTKYKGEDCVVDKYAIMATSMNTGECQRASITIRIKRNPIIGDKFASRSGQKGIMSRLYPVEDLPFSERGIMPDIIFNPHGIPSRMTAGKLIELVAGKSAAEFGKSFDSTPFEFSDENPAHEYFGKILEKAGFNYYGEDVLYSGVDGRMLEVEIFEGVIYYQRLRHMTADKWQVRATGAVDMVTHQPVKGRKRGGAIRFGEMERDCLISHGAAYTLKDRLLDCSDISLGGPSCVPPLTATEEAMAG